MGEDSLTVALAATSEQRRHGLSDLAEFPASVDGMLFAWDQPTSAVFGMGDVAFDLDIWWFDEDGHLLGMAAMETCPDSDCVDYASPGPVMWVLETAAGVWAFDAGDRLSTVENR